MTGNDSVELNESVFEGFRLIEKDGTHLTT
jgi:hypothetical protein